MSSSEILVVLAAVLLLFGGKRLPEILRTWVKFTRELRRNYLLLKRQVGLDDIDDFIDRKK